MLYKWYTHLLCLLGCSFVCHFNFNGEHTVLQPFLAHWTYSTHCHLCPTMYSFSPETSEAFQGEVPCRGHTIGTIPKIERGYFSENPAPSGVRNRTAGSDTGKAPRSNQYATSLSVSGLPQSSSPLSTRRWHNVDLMLATVCDVGPAFD